MSRARHHRVLVRWLGSALLLLVAVTLPACEGATDPGDGALDQLNELGIHDALLQRMTVFNQSAEANVNLGHAFESEVRALDPFPPELFGHTLAFSFDNLEWGIDEGQPAVGEDVLRVIWYQVLGESLVDEPRGHIDLTRQPEPVQDMDRIRVQVVRTTAPQANLTDYVLRFGTTTAAGVETRTVEAIGEVSDGSSAVLFTHHEISSEETGTGDATTFYELTMASGDVSYTGTLDGSQTVATGAETVTMDLAVTMGTVTTRVELDVQEASGQATTGSGEVVHAGIKLADIVVSGNQLSFARPDGGSFSQAQRQRLSNLLTILFNPVLFVDGYFR